TAPELASAGSLHLAPQVGPPLMAHHRPNSKLGVTRPNRRSSRDTSCLASAIYVPRDVANEGACLILSIDWFKGVPTATDITPRTQERCTAVVRGATYSTLKTIESRFG